MHRVIRRGPTRLMTTTANPARINFADTQAAYKDKSNFELLRAYVIFKLCTVRPLVKNATKLVNFGKRVAPGITTAIIRETFFAHFCVGDEDDVMAAALARLQRAGIGGILDYAAEADVDEAAPAHKGNTAASAEVTTTVVNPAQQVAPQKAHVGQPANGFSTRVSAASTTSAVDAAKELELNGNLQKSVESVRKSGGGFAAVKITGLAEPALLEHVSRMLHDHRRAFRRFNTPQHANPYLDLQIDRHTFEKTLRGPRISERDANDLFDTIDYMGDGVIDYLEWSDFMATMRVGGLEAQAAAAHAMRGADPAKILSLLVPAAEVDLSGSEQEMLRNVLKRADELAAAARDANSTVMIDAEQTYLQPAIDYITLSVMRKYNRPHPHEWAAPETTHMMLRAKHVFDINFAASTPSLPAVARWPFNAPEVMAVAINKNASTVAEKQYPVVYNTYQAYLKDTASRLQLDLRRAEREKFLFGCKLVRGAYMATERPRAAKLGYKDPVHDNIENTHASYNNCADLVLQRAVHKQAEIMVASHNENSVIHVTQRMAQLGIHPTDGGVSFGQLLGMCDHISYSLGALHYKVHKYVPFGPVMQVVPYLIRRAEENSDVLGGVGKELTMLRTELKRRLRTTV